MSFKFSETTVESENIMTAVNDTLGKFETDFQDYSYFYNLHKHIFKEKKSSAMMLSEKVILCEINAGLWDKAVTSAICSLTRYTYPHYSIIQKLLNYLLNSQSDSNFGLLEELFSNLLLSHPPKPEMFHYYKAILCDYFIILNKKGTKMQSSFFCLLEAFSSCLQTQDKNLRVSDENFESVEYQRQHFLEVIDEFNYENLNNFSLTKINNMYFEKLPWNEKVKRCLISLNFSYNIFETNFAFCLHSKTQFGDKTTTPLLSQILWPKKKNIGLIKSEVKKILNIYQLIIKSADFNFPNAKIFDKLVSLVAELIRISDRKQSLKYPFFGTNSVTYSRKLSKILSSHLIELYNENKLPKESIPIVNLKPPWFRLLLCSHILSFITGYHCPPDLTGVYDLLVYVVTGKIGDEPDDVERAAKLKTSVNLEMVETFSKMKNINAKVSEGNTLLQLACKKDDTEEIKALFTFPELDVNVKNGDGWTALHLAASMGHVSSVRELLLFRPKQQDLKTVNTRARGPGSNTPLMCAAREGHVGVCRLLLNHSGSVLLDDLNDLNQTSIKLSKNKRVTNILEHHRKNFMYTIHSYDNFDSKPGYKGLISRICIELIQSYFCTHKTWDVYRAEKRRNESSSSKTSMKKPEGNPEWDYGRYDRDIKINICKLKRLIPELAKMEEFKSSCEIYTRILNFGIIS